MRYFPVFMDLAGETALVIGGGEQAAQKVRLLGKSVVAIRVVAIHANVEIRDLATRGRLVLVERAFEASDLDSCRLAYVTIGDDAERRSIASMAKARGIPVNVVDVPELCTFLTPAIVDRDPVIVAIGTEGTAPVLARNIKATLESLMPANLGRLARFAETWRHRVGDAIADGIARRRFWERLFGGDIARKVLGGELVEAETLCEDSLAEPGRAGGFVGSVALVGAGPGDPDLLTFKALRALQEADVIVADRLVGPGILDTARRDAERIMVGKTPGGPSTSQSTINAILIREAKAGKRVVRLKGGDPLVFGRGGEEIAALRAASIEVEVVPGITAALGCAASLVMPLTERNERRSLTLVTGHASDGPAEHDWQALARPGQAVAIYMGVGAASHIEQRLLAAGIDPATPVTVVENGTLATQRAATGTIAGLTELIIDHRIKGPAIIYLGVTPAAPIAALPRTGTDSHIRPAPQPAVTAFVS